MKNILKLMLGIAILISIILLGLYIYTGKNNSVQEQDSNENNNVSNIIENDEFNVNILQETEKNLVTEQESESIEENEIEETKEESLFENLKGTWNENEYTNEKLSIKFKVPSNWSAYTEEQLQSIIETQKQVLQDVQTDVEINNIRYELLAFNMSTRENIVIMLEKNLSVSETEYLKTIKKQLESMSGIKYEVEEVYTKEIAGAKYFVLDSNAEVNGSNIKQRYYIRKYEECLVAISITAPTVEKIDEIINYFE